MNKKAQIYAKRHIFPATSIEALSKIVLGIYLGKQSSFNALLKYIP